ncbi:MAG: hypothetical protein JWO06_3034, partial [Bacteroidota bacterium]|nr:hypothetical protein [Bacteroidota bacterium]
MQLLKRAFKIILKVIAGITGTILGLVILFIILLRLPSVQNYVTHKAVSFISSKTHSRVELHRLYIDFPKSLVVEDLFAEDMKHDTLAYIKKLSVDIDLLKLINKKVEIRDVTLTNATAYIIRNEVDSSFNFDFIVKAFGSGGKAAPKTVSKDSSAPWQVGVDKVSLENIRGGFTDEVGGTVIKGFIGKLKLDMKAMDISKLSFTGNKLQLQDADVSVFQNKPGKNSPDTAIVLMPLLSLNELALQRVNFVYQNKPGDQSIKVSAANLLIQPDTIDLNRHIIKVKNANIQGTDAIVILRKNANDTISLKAIADSITSPAAPWLIASEKLILSKVSFQFDLSNVKPQPAGVDYNHLLVKDINVNIIKASYSPDRILADIKNISLREKSGFVLKQLKARGVYDNQHIELQDLSLTTNHTSIGNYAKITYSSIASLGTNIADMGIDADLKNTRVSVADILMFAPQLKNIAVFKANQDNVVNVTGKVHGKLKDLEVSNLLVSLLDSTIIDLDGHVVGLPDAINANYDVQLNRVLTNRKDIESIAGTYLPSSINIPSTISLSGTINGSVKNAKATLALKTSSGTADIQAELKMAKSDTQYIVSLSTKELDIGYLLKQPKLLGTVTLTANASGKSFSLPNMVTDLKADIQSLFFNKYRYHNISLTANADSNTYKADVAINDSALIMDLHSALSLVKKQEYVKADLNITGANLQALNLLQQDIRTSGRLSADLQGDIEDLNGSASLSDVILVKGKDTYKLDSVIVVSVNDSKHSALKINSGLVVADYDGTVKIPKLVSSLTHQLNHYFVMFSEADSSKLDTSDQNFTLTVKVLPNPIINDVLLPSLTAFNGAELDAKYDGSKSNLDVNISVPVFTYGSSSLDDAKVKVSANKDALDYKISVANTKSGPLNLAETKLEGNVKDNKVQFGLSVYDRDSAYKLIIGGNLAQEQRKQYKLHLNHDKLVINNTRWHLPEDNFVRFDSSGFFANDLNLSNGEQSLMAQSEGTNGDVLNVLFKQFQLGTLSQI